MEVKNLYEAGRIKDIAVYCGMVCFEYEMKFSPSHTHWMWVEEREIRVNLKIFPLGQERVYTSGEICVFFNILFLFLLSQFHFF